jgi:hypothetical protein
MRISLGFAPSALADKDVSRGEWRMNSPIVFSQLAPALFPSGQSTPAKMIRRRGLFANPDSIS